MVKYKLEYSVSPNYITGKAERETPKEEEKKKHSINLSGKMSYKSGNPLKKILSHKQTTVKLSGNDSPTNLSKLSW